MTKRKSRLIAVLLGAILPGLGHFYLGLFKRGLKFFGLFVIVLLTPYAIPQVSDPLFTILANLWWVALSVIYVWNMVDAYKKTDIVNYGEQSQGNTAPASSSITSSSLASRLGFKKKEEFRPVVLSMMQKDSLPGEQLVDYGICTSHPAFGYLLLSFMLWALTSKNYILALTNQRLIIIKLNAINQPEAYTAYPINSLRCIKDSKSLFWRRNLTIGFPDGHKETFSFMTGGTTKKDWGEPQQQISLAIPK